MVLYSLLRDVVLFFDSMVARAAERDAPFSSTDLLSVDYVEACTG